MPREAADQTPEPQQFPSAAFASMGSTLNSALARCLLATLAMASSGGFGLTGATDHRVLELILTRDLNAPRTP